MKFIHYSPAPEGSASGNIMEERLWDYIDGLSSAEEKSTIAQLIATNAEWKAKHQELLETHELVSSRLELDEPSMRFTKSVMEEIGRQQIAPATRTYIDKKIIWGISLFFLTMILGFLVYVLAQVNWSSGSSTGNLITKDIPKVDWSSIFNSTYTNVFVMVNAILGLMLLDMYLTRKKKAMTNAR